jgi:hypothetical protein
MPDKELTKAEQQAIRDAAKAAVKDEIQKEDKAKEN